MTQHVFIIHGFEGNPHGNWFDWLATKARGAGAEVQVPQIPEPNQPIAHNWQLMLDRIIGVPNENIFLVGHSLGCITLLHFLSRHQPTKLGGLILAAGFTETLPRLPELDNYISASSPDFSVLKQINMPKQCLISNNDDHVPTKLTEHMAQQLSSPLVRIENGGHLMAENGFTELPQAWQALLPILQANR